MKTAILLIFAASVVAAQPIGQATSVVRGASLPTSCQVGQVWFQGNSSSGSLYTCTAANTWAAAGSGSASIACVGTPGNTTGTYRQVCQTSAGALYACNNAAGCTVAADWVAQGSGANASVCPLASSLGFLLNGTDETTKLVSTFAAFYAAGGGCLAIDAGKGLRFDSQFLPPTDAYVGGSGVAPSAPYYRITGAGGEIAGAPGTYPGSFLDIRYASGPGILMRGWGVFEIDHITIKNGGSGSSPFLETTGTLLNLHDTQFFGRGASGSAVQDAVVLGGTNISCCVETAADPFQGYGTKIEHNQFTGVLRAVVAQTYANQVWILNTSVQGGNLSTPGNAIDIQGVGVGGYANRNVIIRGNLIEHVVTIGGGKTYTCAINLHNTESAVIDDNGSWDDPGGSFLLCGDSTATLNKVGKGNFIDQTGGLFVNSTWSTNNYMPWRTIPFYFDGGGVALTGPISRCGLVSVGGQINQFSMFADQTGNATVTVKAIAFSSYTGPISATDISNGGETMTGNIIKQDTALSGWSYSNGTQVLPANTMLCFTLSSPSTVTWVGGNVQIWEGR